VAGKTLEDGVAKWNLANTGIFLQDTWTMNDKLTLNFGVRYDQMDIGDKPAANAAAAAAPIAGSVNGLTVTRATGGMGVNNTVVPDGYGLYQPRFGFNYLLDNTKDSKKQIRGGFGLFQGAAANVWISNPFSNTGLATRVYGCGGSFSACPTTDGLFNPDPTKQPTNFSNATPAANVDTLASNLHQPSVWKMNLAFEAELPMGLTGSVEWVGTKVKDGIYYQQLNLGAPTAKGTDGRDLFYTPAALSGSCWSATGSIITTGTLCGASNGNNARTRALSNPNFNNVLQATGTNKGGGNEITFAISQPTKQGFGWQIAYTRTNATEVSPLTSSTSSSGFNSRSIFNPNEDVAANSAYLIRDRVSGSVNWSKAFVGSYKTTVGVFYEGRKGKPYSWIYRNDLNGDGTVNDLMYIPKAPGSGEVVFLGDSATNNSNETLFWNIVNQYKSLRDSKGSVVSRNNAFSPWVNSFDVRLSQEIPGFFPKHKGIISFDILNFGNLLNNRWGRINEMNFQSAGGQRRTFVNYAGLDSQGRYIYQVNPVVDDYTLRQVKGESQWAMQITAKYEF